MSRLPEIQALLAAHPGARLAAGARDSRPMDVPEVSVTRELCLPAKIFDTLLPADFEKLILTLAHCRDTGHGRVEAHFGLADAELVSIDMFDTLDEVDVVLCVLTPLNGDATFLDRLLLHHTGPRRSRLAQNAVGNILDVDRDLEQVLGYAAGELVGHRSTDFLHPDDFSLMAEAWRHVMAEPEHPRLERVRFRTRGGTYTWFDVLTMNRLASDAVIIWTFEDVSDDIAAQQRLAERERLLHQMTESLPLGVVQVDATGAVRHANRRLAAVLGFPVVVHIGELGEHVDAGDQDVLKVALQRALRGEDVDVRVTVAPPHDRVRVCEVNMRGLTGESLGDGALVCVTEVTESVRLQQQLEHQATHDSLTGCLNRHAILAFLNAEVARVNTAGLAALFIDLDLFKKTNDRHGHAAGDEILSVVGSRLANLLRPGDAVGRLGGDEFLAVFRDVASLGEAEKLGYRVAAALSCDIHVGDVMVASSASVGVSWSQDESLSADEIVARADAAMYVAKRVGGHASVIHRMSEVLRERATVPL